MGRVRRPTYTRPVPPDAPRRTRKGVAEVQLTIGGKTAWWPVKDVKGVARATVTVADWHAEYRDAAGNPVRERVGPEKAAAEALLLRRLKEVARRKAGLTDPGDELAAADPLKLLADYLEVLAAKGAGDGHRANVRRHVKAAVAGAGWTAWGKLSADSLTVWLAEKRRAEGVGPATLNGIWRSVRGWANWCAKKGRVRSPLEDFGPFNERVDRRRSVWILPDDQFAALLASLDTWVPRRGMTGRARGLLYLTAAYTGFRASELAALTPARFALDRDPPGVTLRAGEDKAKRGAVQPVPPFLADALRPFLAGREAGKPVWPGSWAKNKKQVVWLAADLTRAGLSPLDPDGKPVTFHSLRRRFVSAVVRVGTAKEAQELARHSTIGLTLDVYAQARADELAAVVAKLKPPGELLAAALRGVGGL